MKIHEKPDILGSPQDVRKIIDFQRMIYKKYYVFNIFQMFSMFFNGWFFNVDQ